MSIWCSHGEVIGYEPTDWFGTKFPDTPERGEVRSYASGFSNHYPDTAGDYEQPGAIALAHIAPWCTPGHDEDCEVCGTNHDYPECGGWVRMEVVSHEHIWEEGGKPSGKVEGASVVMDEPAARELARQLLAWADRPHVQPVEAQEGVSGVGGEGSVGRREPPVVLGDPGKLSAGSKGSYAHVTNEGEPQ